MRKELPKLDNPLNADERLLYAIAVRLDRIIELLDNDVKVEEPVKATPRKRKKTEVVTSDISKKD